MDQPVQFVVPILRDLRMRTPLDICLSIEPMQKQPLCPRLSEFFSSCKKRASQGFLGGAGGASEDSAHNIVLAGLMLENCQDYGLLNASPVTLDALIHAIRLALPAAKSFLEARILKTEHPMLNRSQPNIREKQIRTYLSNEGEFGVITAPVWGDVTEITEDLFEEQGAPQPTRFE